MSDSDNSAMVTGFDIGFVLLPCWFGRILMIFDDCFCLHPLPNYPHWINIFYQNGTKQFPPIATPNMRIRISVVKICCKKFSESESFISTDESLENKIKIFVVLLLLISYWNIKWLPTTAIEITLNVRLKAIEYNDMFFGKNIKN